MNVVESFECPKCGAVSYHPEDVRFGYCGRCHEFTRGHFLDLLDLLDAEPERPVENVRPSVEYL